MEQIILLGISVIFALIGFYFVVRIWTRWRYMDKEVLKARVSIMILVILAYEWFILIYKK